MIKDKNAWIDYITKNATDYFGFKIMKVAMRVAEMLDEDQTPLHNGYFPDRHTAHGIICIADEEERGGGLTGAIADYIIGIIVECHSRGEEFRIASNNGKESNGLISNSVATINI